MQKSYYNFLLYFTIFLVLFSLYCALTIGLGIDESFHHTNGALRYLYLTTLGKFDGYEWENTRYYPGLYDTIHYALAKLIDTFVDIKYVVEIKHLLIIYFLLLEFLDYFL